MLKKCVFEKKLCVDLAVWEIFLTFAFRQKINIKKQIIWIMILVE